MTGLSGQRITDQSRAHASSSLSNIYTILLAHVGEAVSFVVCAIKEPRQPSSHCFGDALSFLSTSGGKKLPLPRQVLRDQDSEPSERSCLFWEGNCPSNPGWLEPNVTRASGPREDPFLRECTWPAILGAHRAGSAAGILEEAAIHPGCWLTCPVLAFRNRATGLIILLPDQRETAKYPNCWGQDEPM